MRLEISRCGEYFAGGYSERRLLQIQPWLLVRVSACARRKNRNRPRTGARAVLERLLSSPILKLTGCYTSTTKVPHPSCDMRSGTRSNLSGNPSNRDLHLHVDGWFSGRRLVQFQIERRSDGSGQKNAHRLSRRSRCPPLRLAGVANCCAAARCKNLSRNAAPGRPPGGDLVSVPPPPARTDPRLP